MDTLKVQIHYTVKLQVSVISSDPSCKVINARFATVPLKPLSAQKGRIDTSVFLTRKLFVFFRREYTKENKQFKETKTFIANS